VDTLRIIDCDQDDESSYNNNNNNNSSSIASVLKRSSMNQSSDIANQDPATGDAVPKIRAQTDSTKLRDFLNNLGGD